LSAQIATREMRRDGDGGIKEEGREITGHK
jgi:hypothetical protein